MPQDSVSRHSPQYPIRLPTGMREQIKAVAKANGRSMNAEIVARLQASFSEEGPDIADIVKAAVKEALEEVRDKT